MSRSRFCSSSSGTSVLVERHLAARERLDLLRDDVADDDLVAELGEAGPRDEADPAGAEDAYPCHAPDSTSPLASGLRPFAIASMVSLESVSSSVLTTQ